MNNELLIQGKNETAAQPAAERAIQPAGWRTSLLLFGVPAVVTFFAFHALRPWLETQGYTQLTSYLAALTVPLALLFAAALIAYHKIEGRPLTWAAFSARMRYPRLRARDLLIGIGLYIAGSIGLFAFSQLGLVLIRIGIIPLPTNLPVFANPLQIPTIDMLNQAAGGQIHGQWETVLLFAVLFFFNMAGEELWWRGYILPKQELVFGRYTWLVHGTLWACFHIFKWWDVIGLLPVCWLLAYSAQRMKTNWPALIAHILLNIGGLLIVVLAVIH